MEGSANPFTRRSEENLLQLWKGRDSLRDYQIDPLRDEIERRGLMPQAQAISDHGTRESIYGELPPGPKTYGNTSCAYWALKELWLRHKTRTGERAEATVLSAGRTGSSRRSSARVELCYSYLASGQRFEGRIVRDFSVSGAADALAYDYHPGDKIDILIARDNLALSYCPSGLGFLWPIVAGSARLLCYTALFASIVHLLLPRS